MAGSMYHEGSRRLQDRFDARRLADRLEATRVRDRLNAADRRLIGRAPFFFLATADAEGSPDCSYKGGLPGFLRVLAEDEIAWADYDGNGMFRSLGNILVNPKVGLLFIDLKRQTRLRLNGTASLSADDPLLAEWPGGRLLVRVRVLRVFPNCPRYVHKLRLEEVSHYVPRDGQEPPVPAWKREPDLAEVLPVPVDRP